MIRLGFPYTPDQTSSKAESNQHSIPQEMTPVARLRNGGIIMVPHEATMDAIRTIGSILTGSLKDKAQSGQHESVVAVVAKNSCSRKERRKKNWGIYGGGLSG